MEITFKNKDIANIIKIYYYRLDGCNVNVLVNEDNNIDEVFTIEGKNIPVFKIKEIIRATLTSFGFSVSSINVNYGGRHQKIVKEGEVKEEYIPYFQKMVVVCEFANMIEKSINNNKMI